MRSVAISDDDKTMHERSINGIPIFGGRERLGDAIKKTKPDEIIIITVSLDDKKVVLD